jgi:hypothetical protein
MEQPDLWGVTPPMTPAADASRIIERTCWKDCGHCDLNHLVQNGKGAAKRVYRQCKRTGEKTYASSKICDWSDFYDTPAASKPQTRGWDDF